jgi:hypothetical protein
MKSESHDFSASEILATAPVPPDQLAAIKQRDPVLHDLILAHQLGLSPTPHLDGPLWPPSCVACRMSCPSCWPSSSTATMT